MPMKKRPGELQVNEPSPNGRPMHGSTLVTPASGQRALSAEDIARAHALSAAMGGGGYHEPAASFEIAASPGGTPVFVSHKYGVRVGQHGAAAEHWETPTSAASFALSRSGSGASNLPDLRSSYSGGSLASMAIPTPKSSSGSAGSRGSLGLVLPHAGSSGSASGSGSGSSGGGSSPPWPSSTRSGGGGLTVLTPSSTRSRPGSRAGLAMNELQRQTPRKLLGQGHYGKRERESVCVCVCSGVFSARA